MFIFFSRLNPQAASRHQCSYLYRMEAAEFLAAGGDDRWLDFESAPDKLKALCELNKIMAHRPWLLNKQMIKVCYPNSPSVILVSSSFSFTLSTQFLIFPPSRHADHRTVFCLCIQDLVSRTGNDNSRSWCLTELLHAIVILSHFHSLSSFVYATGIEESECRVCTNNNAGVKDCEFFFFFF